MRILPALALAAVSALAGPVLAQRPVEELEDLILDQKDEVDHALFAELASHGTEDAFEALEKVLGKQRDHAAIHAAIAALQSFAGGEAEAEALALLEELSRKGRGTPARLVAVRALVGFGNATRDALYGLLEGARDDAVRGAAGDALAPWLVARGRAEDLELVLDHAVPSPTTGQSYVGVGPLAQRDFQHLRHDAVLVRVLSTRVGEDETALFVARLPAKRTSAPWRRVLAEVLGPREGPVVAGALLDVLAVEDSGVRLAALRALDGREDWSGQVERLRPLLKSEDPAVRRAAALRMGRFGITDPRWRDEVLQFAKDRDSAARMGAAAALADLRTTEAVEALHTLLTDEAWQVRIEAIEATERLRRKESIPLLIDRLEAESGRMVDDVYMALRMLTGEDFGAVPGNWRTWWTGEGEGFVMPDHATAVARDRSRRERDDDGYAEPTFYGIRVSSERVTFVLDVSGSMAEEAKSRPPRKGTVSTPTSRTRSRLDVAKEELAEAVRSLPEDTFFNLVFFETEVQAFARTLQRMQGPVRRKALGYVRDQWPQGSTALYPALRLAFEDPVVDTIYLLSDGHPTEGELTDYAEIREEVQRWNATRHVRVHGIAIGMHSPLLEWLAADTGGEYQRVD